MNPLIILHISSVWLTSVKKIRRTLQFHIYQNYVSCILYLQDSYFCQFQHIFLPVLWVNTVKHFSPFRDIYHLFQVYLLPNLFPLSSFLLITSVCFLVSLVCFSKAFPNGEYSNLFNAAVFSNKSFYNKTSFPVKNSYLLTFPDDKAEILAACLSKFYWALFCLILLLIVLIFSLILIYNKVFLNRNGLSDEKVVSFSKKWIWFFNIFFIKLQEIFIVNVRRMIRWYLLKFSFVGIFMMKKCVAINLIVLGTLK